MKQKEKSCAQGRMFAVAVRDAGRLFLLVRVKRSPEGDVYVFDAHIEPKDWLGPTGWKDWNPHTSYHASGELHQKWFDEELIIRYRPKPDSTFRGTQNLRTMSVGANVPRRRGIVCKPEQFSEVFEIPVDELRTERDPTYIAIDLCEAEGQPTVPPPARILPQAIFRDAVPWILITVYEDARRTDPKGTERQ